MASRVRSLRLPDDLDQAIERARGDVDFGSWVRGALEEKLENDGRALPREGHPGISSAVSPRREGVRLPSSRPASPRASGAGQASSGKVASHDAAAEGPVAHAGGGSSAAAPVVYRCRDRLCGFEARSVAARCPRHGGKLVAA